MKEKKSIVDDIHNESNSLSRNSSLGDSLFQSLRDAIVGGNLVPKTRITESGITKAVGISRTPVREALHKLERDGLVKKHPRGGFSVTGLTYQDILESFDLIVILEGYAARLAAVRHNEEDVHALEEEIEAFEKCIEEKRMEELPTIKKHFHAKLNGLSRNEKLINVIRQIGDQMYLVRMAILRSESLARICNQDHREIVKSLKMRDVEKVERLVRLHILRGKNYILAQLKDRMDESQPLRLIDLLLYKKTRVLIAKTGLDCHSREAKLIARGIKEAGMEVFYTGLYKSVPEIVDIAIQKQVDVIGFSIMQGFHIGIFKELKESLKKKNLNHMLIIVCGMIPKKYINPLYKLGIHSVFSIWSPISEIIQFISEYAPFDLMSKKVLLGRMPINRSSGKSHFS